MKQSSDGLVSLKEVANRFGVSDYRVKIWVSRGCPYGKQPENARGRRKWWFDPEAVAAWLEDSDKTPPPSQVQPRPLHRLPSEALAAACRLAGELVAANHFGGSAWGFLWSHVNPDRQSGERRWPTYAHLIDVDDARCRVRMAGVLAELQHFGATLTADDESLHRSALSEAGYSPTAADYRAVLDALTTGARLRRQVTRLALSKLARPWSNFGFYWLQDLAQAAPEPLAPEADHLHTYDEPAQGVRIDSPTPPPDLPAKIGPFAWSDDPEQSPYKARYSRAG